MATAKKTKDVSTPDKEWFLNMAKSFIPLNSNEMINCFFHCCGGREIGGFGTMVNNFVEFLRVHASQQKQTRDYYVDIFTKFRTQDHRDIRFEAIKSGIRAQLHGIKSLSTIVATTTNSTDQLLAARALKELGFKDVLDKVNSNSNNHVITWVYVGTGKLL